MAADKEGARSVLTAVARFANLALTSLTAGSYAHDLVAFPGFRTFPGPVYARYHRALHARMARVFPPADAAVMLTNVAVLILERERRREPPFVLSTAALALKMAQVVWSGRTVLPLNRVIEGWDVESPPPDWADVRDAWGRGHTVRAALGLAVLGCQILSALAAGSDDGRRRQNP